MYVQKSFFLLFAFDFAVLRYLSSYFLHRLRICPSSRSSAAPHWHPSTLQPEVNLFFRFSRNYVCLSRTTAVTVKLLAMPLFLTLIFVLLSFSHADKRTMRRSQTTTSTTTTTSNGHSKTTTTTLSTSFSGSSSSGMYKGELNQREVQEGFGMGLAVKVRADLFNSLCVCAIGCVSVVFLHVFRHLCTACDFFTAVHF